MTKEELDRLRAKIEELRLSMDSLDADLTRAMTNRSRDALRNRRLEVGEELRRVPQGTAARKPVYRHMTTR